jgi:hypothetical protein
MRDITDSCLRYRECVLGIWNEFLKNPPPDIRFDVHDRWADACVSLFRAIVLYPMDYDAENLFPDYRAEQEPLRVLRVVLVRECEVLITEKDNPTVRDPATVEPDDVDLRFISFWDWDVLGKREFEYVKALIVESKKHPERNNKIAFIKRNDSKIMFDEGAVVEDSGE